MSPSAELDLSKLLNIFNRRKSVIIATFPVVCLLSVYLAWTLPDIYRSSTLILITPQRLPPSYISSTITSSIQERVNAITQQILSRTGLERIITEFNLYPSANRGTTEDRIEQLRKNIHIDIARSDVFRLSFDSDNPEKAMQIATRLTSLFIEENLKVREQQATGTTAFINTEADRLRNELEEQEARVSRYRVEHRFELPDQLDANLRTLQQLRLELQGNLERLASLQERRSNIEKQYVESQTTNRELESVWEDDVAQNGTPSSQRIESLKSQLEALLMQYSEKHPDVIRLKREIQTLEAKAQSSESNVVKKTASKLVGQGESPIQLMYRKQMADLDSEIKSLQARNEDLRGQVGGYQNRIDETPVRTLELTKISRPYDITLKKYQDLEAKGLESQLSENMEKKQKGEQFQILDPANFPQKPFRPNRQFIVFAGLLGGLAAGFALAILWEALDSSFKRSDEIDGYVDVPVLATLPAIMTRGSVLERRRAQGMLVLASAGIFAIGMVFIHFYGRSFF